MGRTTKTLRTHRRNYTKDKNVISREMYDYDKNTYRKRAYSGRILKNQKSPRIQTEGLNPTHIKAAISFIMIIFVFAVTNIDSDLANNIKTALSKNISYSEIEKITLEIEEIFVSEEKEKLKEPDKGYYDFRIDENIVEQMNKKENAYENVEKRQRGDTLE